MPEVIHIPKVMKKTIPRYHTTKLFKTNDKNRIFKATRGKRYITCNGIGTVQADFLSEKMQARKWYSVI